MKLFYKTFLYVSPILFFIFFLNFTPVFAGGGENVFGNAWSDNIGWISFNNCADPSDSQTCDSTVPSHGLTLDIATNIVSGTAYSKSIGIINFNPQKWGGCPPNISSPCSNFQNKWAKGGWAQAFVVPEKGQYNSGGWDGWISLGGGSYNANIDTINKVTMNPTYSVDVYKIDGKSNGFWWGDEVVGWIDLNPKNSPYDVNEGGVFVADLNNGESMTLNGDAYTVAGNEISLTWSAKNFTPTSCTNTSTSTFGNGSSVWDSWWNSKTVSGTSGTITGIDISHNNNNNDGQTTNTSTTFKIECTDGFITKSAVWTVVVNTFEPELYVPFSCILKTNKPTLDILNMKGISPSCDIYGDNSLLGTTSGNTFTDSGFGGHDTIYNMQCTNGTSNKANHKSQNVTAKICQPFYKITGDTRCGTTKTNEKYGGVFVKDGTNYVAKVILKATPYFGYNTSPIDLSFSGTGFTLSNNSFKLDSITGLYNTIEAKYTVSEADYIAKTNNKKDPVVVNINVVPFNESNYNFTLNFCPAQAGASIKPIYKPF